MRRLLDRVPGMKRGQEQLDHSIWEQRMKTLVIEFKQQPMDAQTACKFFSKKYKWPSLYTINVIAAADIGGLIQTIDNQWNSIE